MGGTVENEVVDEIKIDSREADLENVREELRKQLLRRELAQRELEFLAKGGHPLDFIFRHISFVSVHSTSLTGQRQEQIVTSKDKSDTSLFGMLAHSDEPTLQQRKTVCDANVVEDTLLFDVKNQLADVENNSININIIGSSELSSQVEGTYDGKESESTIFRPYARRSRSKPINDISRSALTDILPSRGSIHVPVPSHFDLRDTKGSLFDSNHIDRKMSSSSVEKSTRTNLDKTHMVIDVPNLESRCSSNVETVAGLPKGSSDEDSLLLLTSVVSQVHFVDANRILNEESTEVSRVRKADLLSNGCLRSDNANKNDEANVNAEETESRCVLANGQGEAENGMVKNGNKFDTGHIAFDGDTPDHQNNFEVRVPEISEMDKDFPAGARVSTFSSGTESNSQVASGVGSVHGNIPASDPTLAIEGPVTAETIVHEISVANSFCKSSVDPPETETGCTKELQKVDEDAILAEALLIEAKHKRISQLLTRTVLLEKHPKSHWDFALEEMAWLANDFMQERLWKISTAAQFGHRAALAACQRVEEKMPIMKLKAVAQSNARAVLKFWQSVESVMYNEDRKTSVCNKSLLPFDSNDAVEDQTEESKVVQEQNIEDEQHRLIKSQAIREYAMRFLKNNATVISNFDADAQFSPGPKCSLVTKEEENILKNDLTDESLFYKVPVGAMESYRNAIESHVLQFEVSGGGLHEAERSLYDATEERTYLGEEDKQDSCYLPSTSEGNQASKTAQKKQKNPSNAYASGMNDVGADLNFGSQGNGLYARRIPKKCSRPASHQRHLSEWTDASSEDTGSFQDDHTEYDMKMKKHLLADVGVDLSKIKKKFFPKYLKQRWQDKTPLLDGQRDVFKKRINNQQLICMGFDAAGTIRQPNAKRSKTLKQTLESSFESPGLNKGTVSSDMASQMKNMPHQSQIMRMIGVRGHARKVKSLKGPSGKSRSGNSWSSFEDQALVVLVHDLGPNWNLVSDAMNSAFPFVYIFRKPDECMERQKILMDKTTDDGADSAKDSLSSQPYPSTLPGIPKGSARQLFQRLQGPMEEDTLKSHFEKIMSTRRKQHYRKIRSDVHDHKQVVPNHNSHVIALSEVSTNYLIGGYLTPLDLCDLTQSNLVSISVGQPQSVRPPVDNSSYQGTSDLVTGSILPNAIDSLSAINRDAIYGTSRLSPSTKEQQKSDLMSTQQSSPSVSGTPSVTDRNTVRMVAGTNSTGMMSGLNSHSLPISRVGSQETNLPPIPIAGGVSSSGMFGVQNCIDPRVNSSQETSTSNISGAYMTLNQESQRQMTAHEHHVHATQGNNHGATHPREASSTFSVHNSTPMGPIHPVENQLQHQKSPHQSPVLNHHPRIQGPSVLQHPSYARLIKEQHLQQRLLMQQQSSAPIPTITISQSPMLPQITPLAPIVLPLSPVTLTSQPQQKQHLAPKVRQSSHPLGTLHNPHHPQLARPQQLVKFANGASTGNMITSQNGTESSSHLSRKSFSVGLSADQLASVHGGPAQPVHPQAPKSFSRTFQQKRFHSSAPPTNPVQQTPPNSDNGSQNEILPHSAAHKSSIVQSKKTGKAAGGNPTPNKWLNSFQKNRNESLDNMEKELQQNHQGNTDQQCKDAKFPNQSGAQIKKDSPSSDCPTALPHVTGPTGRASVTSPSSNLLPTDSGLYDSVLRSFDSEMQTAAKPTKNPSAVNPDPTVNKGLVLQRQLPCGMIPSEQKPSQQPDTNCAEPKGTLSIQPTI